MKNFLSKCKRIYMQLWIDSHMRNSKPFKRQPRKMVKHTQIIVHFQQTWKISPESFLTLTEASFQKWRYKEVLKILENLGILRRVDYPARIFSWEFLGRVAYSFVLKLSYICSWNQHFWKISENSGKSTNERLLMLLFWKRNTFQQCLWHYVTKVILLEALQI